MHQLNLLLLSLSIFLLTSACGTGLSSAAETSGSGQELLPLTRNQAAQVLAQAEKIASVLDQQMRSPQRPRSPEETREALVLAGLTDVAVHPSQWRWYSRDGGILAAVPLKERLQLIESVTSEQVLADIIARIINQIGLGYPKVRVVLIEPEYPPRSNGYPVAYPVVPVVVCGCP